MKVSCLIGTTEDGARAFIGEPAGYTDCDKLLDEISKDCGKITKGKKITKYAKVEMFSVGSGDVVKRRKFRD